VSHDADVAITFDGRTARHVYTSNNCARIKASTKFLPAEMREGLVRFRHAVRVFLLLNCAAFLF
jgi:hypothetical protein